MSKRPAVYTQYLDGLKVAKMGSDSFQSPNAIPPRRSSTGLGGSFVNPVKPVLKPVPEGDWIAQGHRAQTSLSSFDHPGSDRPASLDSGADVAIHANGTTWSDEKERIVLGPFDYMEEQPGKDIRKQLIAAFNAWLQVPPASLAIITKVVGMLHTASLLYASPLKIAFT